MFNGISVLVDNDSWILPYAERLVCMLAQNGYECCLCSKHSEVPVGDICFMLGCTKIVSDEILERNRFNMVVHESDLPKGKGFAPVSWQILENKDVIPVCLIEAGSDVDSGDVWLKGYIELSGTELCDEWRRKQGEISIKLALSFVTEFENLKPIKQKGQASFYSRRTPKDSELDCNKSIEEQFNLLRIVDNNRYPAFFMHKGVKYKLEIYRDE